jgi:hypothetical protein
MSYFVEVRLMIKDFLLIDSSPRFGVVTANGMCFMHSAKILEHYCGTDMSFTSVLCKAVAVCQ